MGREIDRFIYGGHTLEVEHSGLPIDHSGIAVSRLLKNSIGTLLPTIFIRNENTSSTAAAANKNQLNDINDSLTLVLL